VHDCATAALSSAPVRRFRATSPALTYGPQSIQLRMAHGGKGPPPSCFSSRLGAWLETPPSSFKHHPVGKLADVLASVKPQLAAPGGGEARLDEVSRFVVDARTVGEPPGTSWAGTRACRRTMSTAVPCAGGMKVRQVPEHRLGCR
jgi:hypothetical protein